MQKCAACQFEADNFPECACPRCGKKLALSATISPWLQGLALAVVVTGFMLAYHFPRPMVAVFALAAYLVSGFSGRRRTLPAPSGPAQLTMCRRPLTVMLLNIAIVICSLAFVIVFMASFLVFMGSWSQWSATRGQSYHATSFQVMKVHFQQPASGAGPWVSASGMVEGKQEHMDLLPYLKFTPHSQEELERRVPRGAVIPVYLFPALKDGWRVQFIGSANPPEAAHQRMTFVLCYGLPAMALLVLLIALLFRLRRACNEPLPQAFAASA